MSKISFVKKLPGESSTWCFELKPKEVTLSLPPTLSKLLSLSKDGDKLVNLLLGGKFLLDFNRDIFIEHDSNWDNCKSNFIYALLTSERVRGPHNLFSVLLRKLLINLKQ